MWCWTRWTRPGRCWPDAINLAIITRGRVSGWTDFPALGWRFHTTGDALWFNGRTLHPVPGWPDTVKIAVDARCVSMLPARLPDGRDVLAEPCGGVAYRLALLALGAVQAVWLPPTPVPRFGLWDVLSMAAGLRHIGAAAHGWRGDQDLTQQRPAVWGGGLLAGPADFCNLLREVLPDQAIAQDHTESAANEHWEKPSG